MRYLLWLWLLCPLVLAQSIGDTSVFQNGSFTPLTGDPTLGLSGGTQHPYLEFATIIPIMSGTVTFTLNLKGADWTAPVQVNFTSPQALIQGFVLPRGYYSATPGTLTVSFGSTTETFAFSVIEPVPEPATLILMGIGLLGIAGIYRYRNARLGCA